MGREKKNTALVNFRLYHLTNEKKCAGNATAQKCTLSWASNLYDHVAGTTEKSMCIHIHTHIYMIINSKTTQNVHKAAVWSYKHGIVACCYGCFPCHGKR